jgi:hypothetical protein
MQDWNEQNLKWFFDNIEPIANAYDEPVFSFLVHRSSKGNQLVGARLLMSPIKEEIEDKILEVGDILGFHGTLSTFGIGTKELIEALRRYRLPFIDGTILLNRSDNNPNEPSFHKVDRGYSQPESNTLNFELSCTGFGGYFRFSEEELWQLRASNPPFFNVQELLTELVLGTGDGLEILALAPVAIGNSSLVGGESATVHIHAAEGLNTNNIHLGVIVHRTDGHLERKHFGVHDIKWKVSTVNPSLNVGEIQFDVPKASVLRCHANYNDRCYNTYWVHDPTTSQNYRRAVLEIFDKDLRKTHQQIDQGRGGSNSEGHENAVASIMWMLGFAPINCGKLVEAPDLIGVSAAGDILVVECTLGDMKAKRGNKIQNLLDRTKLVREALIKANSGFLQCIPVMFSSRNAEDIQDDLMECEKRGIVAFSNDDVDELFESTISGPNSNARVAKLKERLERQQARIQANDRTVDDLEKQVDNLKRSLKPH